MYKEKALTEVRAFYVVQYYEKNSTTQNKYYDRSNIEAYSKLYKCRTNKMLTYFC